MFDPTSSSAESLHEKLKQQSKSDPNRVDKVEATSFDGIESSGFKFHKQPIPDILAYCFGDEKGEKKLKEINEKARIYSDNNDKKKYIEDQLRDYAKGNVDDKISGGLKENFFGASEKYQQAIKEGKIKDGERLTLENAGSIDKEKDPMFSMLKGLGLNISGDNCRADYQETVNASGAKVKVLSLSFVNRPTTNIIDPDSQHQKLASAYANTLNDQEKKQFQDSFARHTENARNGEPKMSVDDFNKSCNTSLDKQIAEIKKSKSQSTTSEMDKAKQQASEVAKEMASKKDISSATTSQRHSMQRSNSSQFR
jgi:hypothetical protein